MSRVTLRGKTNAEIRNEIFDFTSSLAVSETISSAAVSAAVYSGSDSAPQDIVSGSASISGAQVTQKLRGGVVGTVYLLTATANTSTSQTLKLYAFLPIVPESL